MMQQQADEESAKTKGDASKDVVTDGISVEDVTLDDLDGDHIYDIVDAIVPRTDDPSMPALTIRVWILGLFWCCLLSVPCVLSNFRTNPFSVSAGVAAILSYPMGVFMAWALPKRNVSLGPFSFSLNPGPFSIKEHALIYIWADTGAIQPYAVLNIIGQKYMLYQEHLSTWSAMLFVFSTQCFGFGFAGLCRRYLVRPATMLWPSTFSTIALLNSFHERKDHVADSQFKMSRFKFFWLACGFMTVYQLIPSMIAPILGSICVLCYIAPQTSNPKLWRTFGSGLSGYGFLGITFDWSLINGFMPITSPLWATLCNMFGAWFLLWVVVPILWSTNAFQLDQQIPPNTNSLFNSTGHSIEPFEFVDKVTLQLDEDIYQANAPFYISTFFAVSYMQSFMIFSAVFVHIALWNAKDIYARFKTAMKDLDSHDIHAQLMDAYPEVSDSWYLSVLVLTSISAFVSCIWGGFDLEWWAILLAMALALVNLVPIGIVQGISGQSIGINVISEFLIGLLVPGHMIAVTTFKTFSTNAASQGLTLASDLKLGHYMKIPPRAMFISQLVSAVVAGIVQQFMTTSILESFGRSNVYIDNNDPSRGYQWKLWVDPPPGYTSTGFNTFTNAGAIWGAIGPARFFGSESPYSATLWSFLIGAILPVIPWALHKRNPTSFWHLVNIPVILAPSTNPGNSNSILITPVIVAVLFNYFIKKYMYAWWKRYAFTLSAGFDTGAVLGVLVVFVLMNVVGVRMPNYFLNPESDAEGCFPDGPDFIE